VLTASQSAASRWNSSTEITTPAWQDVTPEPAPRELAPAWFSELEVGVVDARGVTRSSSLGEAIGSGAITGDPTTAAELQRFIELDSVARVSTAAVLLVR